MSKFITIGNKKIFIGSKLISTKNAQLNGLCKEGICVEVITIINSHDNDFNVGVKSSVLISGWHDLDGRVEDKTGLWLSRDCIVDNFRLMTSVMLVNSDYIFKKRNLKSKSCKILSYSKIYDGYLVEFEDNIGGTGAEGLGKLGHCCLLPKVVLKQTNNVYEDFELRSNTKAESLYDL